MCLYSPLPRNPNASGLGPIITKLSLPKSFSEFSYPAFVTTLMFSFPWANFRTHTVPITRRPRELYHGYRERKRIKVNSNKGGKAILLIAWR